MTPRRDSARPRYQRKTREVQPRKGTHESYHDAWFAAIAFIVIVVLIWGMGLSYQAGLHAGAAMAHV
jgi:Flp pilus assembly protein TadB